MERLRHKSALRVRTASKLHLVQQAQAHAFQDTTVLLDPVGQRALRSEIMLEAMEQLFLHYAFQARGLHSMQQ